jgi:nickel transport protein
VKARLAAVVGLATALLVPGQASAHEILSSVERGRAVAVKAFFSDGEPLAYAEFQVFSPADAKIPYQKGRTDRSGYLAFVPNLPGNWHVRVSDASGHGLELDVAAAEGQQAQGGTAPTGPASWAFLLRPVLGVLLIAALFVGLLLFYRRKGAPK